MSFIFQLKKFAINTSIMQKYILQTFKSGLYKKGAF